MVTLDASQPVDDGFRTAVSAAIDDFLAGRRATLTDISPALDALSDRAQLFTAGGKRLRPAFCTWGWAACSDRLEIPDAVVTAAASLDVLHVSALIHDDVMDASDTRRGVPSAHRQFEQDHRDLGGRGDAESFGRAAAILLGDMLLVWSEEMLANSGLSADELGRVAPWIQAVRTEVTAGQFLDVMAQSVDPYARTRTPDGVAQLEELVTRVVTYKSACYTVERPLHIGAAIAGASADQLQSFSAFGRPLGRAFQYRDDLLGVFGDESLTGKESGEDLREGKLTLLVVKTLANATDAAAREFTSLFGASDLASDQIDTLREIISSSGAQGFVEEAIRHEHALALSALEDARWLGSGREGLENLARAAVERTF